MEFLDRRSVHCAERATDSIFFAAQPGRPVLLVEFDGSARDLATGKKVVKKWIRKNALAARDAATDRSAERLWQVRRKCSGAMFELGNTKLNEDVVVPLARQVEFYAFLEELQRESGLAAPTFGHAADGNFHVNIMYDRDDPKQSRHARKAVRSLMEKVVALEGTITGEHGIGLAKTPFLDIARSRAEIGAMRAIKKALDPNGILNPGKIFERFQVWNHRPIEVKLPWDHKNRYAGGPPSGLRAIVQSYSFVRSRSVPRPGSAWWPGRSRWLGGIGLLGGAAEFLKRRAEMSTRDSSVRRPCYRPRPSGRAICAGLRNGRPGPGYGHAARDRVR